MPKTLLLHTGGTLGMSSDPLVPGDYAAALINSLPELSKQNAFESKIVCNLDSSDIGPEQWTTLAEIIDEEREKYSGFIIIHGTDTMAYTASALAFALEGLDRPVILTGAQRPLAALRSDARRNLADALELATLDLPEVSICFDGLLFRGCRSEKTNIRAYHAFSSPGCEPIARLGVDIEIGSHLRRPLLPFRCDARFDPRVIVVKATPGMTPELLRALIVPQTELAARGVVLAPFGVGTIPNTPKPLAPVIRDAVDSGVEVLVASPAVGRVNLELYENSAVLQDAGAIPAGEMTIEAALTKLMHALAIHKNRATRRRYLTWNVAGELD